MRALAITDWNLEDCAAREINGLIKTQTTAKETMVLFDAKPEELAKVAYHSQTIYRLMAMLDSFSFGEKEDPLKKLKKSVESSGLAEWFEKKTTFCVRSLMAETKEMEKNMLEPKMGEFVLNKIKKEKNFTPAVSLEKPNVLILIYFYKNSCYWGIDLAGDLSHRDYKIFTNRHSLKGPLAASLLHLAGYTGKEKLLLPFVKDGTLAVEAGYCSGKISLQRTAEFSFLKLKPFRKIDWKRFFLKEEKKRDYKIKNIFASDSFSPNAKAAEKNISIAKLSIKVSRLGIEQTDVLFKKGEIDCGVCYLASLEENQAKELLYQIFYVLKKGGIFVLMTGEKFKLSENKELKLKEKRETKRGENKYQIFILQRR
ncbi:MAG TPA: THUMP domain-containing protein [Candidatus Nanoarchaeia archaeon]|nr:THUMP domain-containing protein [Candidatus Nanoarchaeia archaeon]